MLTPHERCATCGYRHMEHDKVGHSYACPTGKGFFASVPQQAESLAGRLEEERAAAVEQGRPFVLLSTAELEDVLALIRKNRNPAFGSYGDLTRAENTLNRLLNAARSPATQAEMAAFGASDAACYLYPGADQQAERAAFCAGAAWMVPQAPVEGGAWRLVPAELTDEHRRAVCAVLHKQGMHEFYPRALFDVYAAMIATAPKAPSVPAGDHVGDVTQMIAGDTERRERIARIIDPEPWETRDFIAGHGGDVSDYLSACEPSLEKADAIIADTAGGDDDPHAPCGTCSDEHPEGVLEDGLCPSCVDGADDES